MIYEIAIVSITFLTAWKLVSTLFSIEESLKQIAEALEQGKGQDEES